MPEPYVRPFEQLSATDVATVGGKNASLGEMIRALEPAGVRVPAGFATTADAYRRFVRDNGIEAPLRARLDALASGAPLSEVGAAIRELFLRATWPQPIARAIREAYRALGARYEQREVDVAVRSSATAEDLPEASFAGQQETFLHVRGEPELLDACRRCFASLFTDRAIGYRAEKGFDHLEVALSVGVQKMVRSDLACAGVMFTIDTDSGFPDVIVIEAAWGLGESVVAGTVDPDRFLVFTPLLERAELVPILEKTRGAKDHEIVYARVGTERVATSAEKRGRFALDDAEVLDLARAGAAIARHYARPMDVEWAKDGTSGRIFVVQARPETVQSRRSATVLHRFELEERGELLASGLAIGDAIGAGKAFVLRSAREGERFEDGGVLIAEMTDPDWGPVMRRASAIVTDHGGRTSHAAIVSRELGVPAVIGTGNATHAIEDGAEITVSCAEGEKGRVYRGILRYASHAIDVGEIPSTRTRVMINLASPEMGLAYHGLPARGVGLARLEFLIGGVIRAHPMALVHPERVQDADERAAIERLIDGYPDGASFFVDVLSRGIAKIAASRHPDPVIVRFSDFKTNEYAALVGGRGFEPPEDNPMIGFRGASRYYDERYREAFELECVALRRAREVIGLRNVVGMIPFCRTPEEADRVIEVMRGQGLERGREGFALYVMAEIPSNVILARELAARFDGFSIGSNDLTQLVLGVDRDSELVAHLFHESDAAVVWAIRRLVEEAHACGRPVGLCGQAPSDDPGFARFLVEAGIDSISVDPGSFVAVVKAVAEAERR